jgi:hypothetical protein
MGVGRRRAQLQRLALVSVPVLSEQTADADPSVSTDDSFFTIA